MDNPELRVNGEGRERLLKAMDLAFGLHGACKGWCVIDDTLILLWHLEKDDNTFLAPITKPEEIVDTILNWLKMQPPSAYSNDLADRDVDQSKGWLLFVEQWGHVKGATYAICGIRPHYLWAGK